jgi:hypothetical protein
VTGSDSDTDVRRDLLECLQYQRSSVRSIVDGLSENAWHTPVVASGWTIAGLVEHLRVVVLHIIEETAAHSGHLEIARELLDGRTDLGLR